MEGEEPPEEGEGTDTNDDSPSIKSKSKSPTPGVLDTDNSRSKSPTPDVPENETLNSKSPTPGAAESDNSRSKSPTPGLSESEKSRSKSPGLESDGGRSKSPTPGSVDTEKSKSLTPIPEGVELESSKSKSPTPGAIDSDNSRSKSPTPDVLASGVSRSKSPTPELADEKKSRGKSPSPQIPDFALSKSITSDVVESLKAKSKSASPDVPEYVIPKQATTSATYSGSKRTGDSTFRGGSLAAFRSAAAGFVPSGNMQGLANGLLQKRSPFIHNPPEPEERRQRIQSPRTPREYIINLREDLADFQESHGLPRTRDYSFVSLGLALAQETGRAIYSLLQMFTELFPVIAIVSLILRFALDKMIEILETPETFPKIKKTTIFILEIIAILIPLWILIAMIVIPLISLILSMFKRIIRIKGKRTCGSKPKPERKVNVKPTTDAACSLLF
ncbi:hypothetical protein RUM44_005269 [Polyplax serrata]|uniref:Uncharacterized protein n=1 Tax=Polyplax serrata TaxID=468196 RepID=A0ABR1AEZ6_POLSC